MATQFITRDEYSGGNDQLFLRFSALLNTQLDLVRTEMRANTANLVSAINARFDKNESDITEIRNFQQAMMQAFQAVTTDITRQVSNLTEIVKAHGEEMREFRQEVRDGFAETAERHNELMQRVSRLEPGKQEYT